MYQTRGGALLSEGLDSESLDGNLAFNNGSKMAGKVLQRWWDYTTREKPASEKQELNVTRFDYISESGPL
jgi:hypothetical protein